MKQSQPPVAEKPRSDSLFGSPSPPPDEGLLFGAPPTKPAPETGPSNQLTGSGEALKEKKSVTTESAKGSSPKVTSKKPKEKTGGLFDDDESDDDLFGSSAASAGKKGKQQAGDLFSGPPPTKPASKPAKLPQKQAMPEPSSLFGSPPTSDPLGGDLFAASVEKPAKPQNTQPSQPKPDKRAPDQQQERSQPPETRPKKPVNQQTPPTKLLDSDLFGTSESSQTDPHFSAASPAGEKTQPPALGDQVPVATTTGAAPKRKKPAGAVSLFGGVDLLGGRGLGEKTHPISLCSFTTHASY